MTRFRHHVREVKGLDLVAAQAFAPSGDIVLHYRYSIDAGEISTDLI
jgi:hypothetical protein